MNALKNTDIHYKGEIIDMFDFHKKQRTQNENVDINDLLLKIKNIEEKVEQISSKNETDNKNNKFLNFFNAHPFGLSVAASIIATLIISSFTIINYFASLPSKLNSIEKKLDEQISNYDGFKSGIDEEIGQLKVNVATIANVSGVYLYSDLEYTDDFISQLSSKNETVKNTYYSSAPPCKYNEVIAIDNKSGITYTKKQLAGEKLLIPYTYNGQEVLFYGQYSENNNWDKDCTINVYKNNKLILISETVYDNGTPISSKMIYPYETKEKINVWCITNREYNKKFNNIDETWNYYKVKEYPKTFDFENAKIDDLLYVSQLENEIKNFSSLDGYYCDKIEKDIKTNEEKIISYMIKNDENGFIRTFYKGKFTDGDFHDQTGEAIEIVFDGTVNKYFYYIGTFTNGKRDSNDNLTYITQDEINEIVKPNDFNCELNWYDTTKDTD